mmetsp:Transcript_28918/g.97514  ORF Transcript_28918/g.97514 Transcript_28918/m.97514 type:complete len:217 (-) Transcript_28918:2133-2783(-)
MRGGQVLRQVQRHAGVGLPARLLLHRGHRVPGKVPRWHVRRVREVDRHLQLHQVRRRLLLRRSRRHVGEPEAVRRGLLVRPRLFPGAAHGAVRCRGPRQRRYLPAGPLLPRRRRAQPGGVPKGHVLAGRGQHGQLFRLRVRAFAPGLCLQQDGPGARDAGVRGGLLLPRRRGGGAAAGLRRRGLGVLQAALVRVRLRPVPHRLRVPDGHGRAAALP